MPIGSISMFGGSTPPANWLICDGTSYPTAAPYDKLFAVLQYVHGGSAREFQCAPTFRASFRWARGRELTPSLPSAGSLPITPSATANLPVARPPHCRRGAQPWRQSVGAFAQHRDRRPFSQRERPDALTGASAWLRLPMRAGSATLSSGGPGIQIASFAPIHRRRSAAKPLMWRAISAAAPIRRLPPFQSMLPAPTSRPPRRSRQRRGDEHRAVLCRAQLHHQICVVNRAPRLQTDPKRIPPGVVWRCRRKRCSSSNWSEVQLHALARAANDADGRPGAIHQCRRRRRAICLRLALQKRSTASMAWMASTTSPTSAKRTSMSTLAARSTTSRPPTASPPPAGPGRERLRR